MSTWVFRNSKIGNLDAESDQLFLDNCFVTTSMYETLLNFNKGDPNSFKRVIVGRTGSGKTAILKKLSVDKLIKLSGSVEAESTVFEHIMNNVFISNLILNKVDLRAFYKSLWVHVLLVKIIELLFEGKNSSNIFETIQNALSQSARKNKQQTSDYVEKYKENFFNDKVLTEITDKLQSEVSGKLNLKFLDASGLLTEEQVEKVQRETSRYVSSELLRQQKDIISSLAKTAPSEEQRKILISIDDLDRSWLSSHEIRYDFINALLDAFKELMDIRAVKILISIRTDILNGVYENNLRQDEKDKSLIIPIEWNKHDIRLVLDRRISYLIKDQYSKNHNPTFKDIFDFSVRNEPAEDFILDRTMLRPRDAIDFVNMCFSKAEGETTVSEDAVIDAEESFYSSRKTALCKEWQSLYPHIEGYIDCLSFIPEKTFDSNVFSNNQCATQVQSKIIEKLSQDHQVSTKISEGNFEELLKVWFMVGVVGIKKTDTLVVYSSFEKQKLDITDLDKEFCIHPLFWRRK